MNSVDTAAGEADCVEPHVEHFWVEILFLLSSKFCILAYQNTLSLDLE